jgi:broad specificity phosphatase PhoE
MAILRFVTHPQVRISADIPVPRWGLSDIGRTRAKLLAKQPWLADTTRLISSDETKALETASIIAAAIGRTIEVREQLHENDRSSTGFVPPDRFEMLADAFFAHPHESVEGWETAHTAQQRIIDATADLRTYDTHRTTDTQIGGRTDTQIGGQGDVLIIGHSNPDRRTR